MSAKILVVDDEDVIRRSLVEVLNLKGYEILTASNGQEALDILEKEDIAVTLLDLNMPIMDGIETMRKVGEMSTETENSVKVDLFKKV